MRALLAFFFLTHAPLVFAQGKSQPVSPISPVSYANMQLEDEALEAEAMALMESLRCLTCQSQSIADSDAPMARDMRHQVRIRLKQGQSSQEIRHWLISAYGDYVSYEPQISRKTWPLFVVPFIIALSAAVVFGQRLKKANRG